jgi:hypothetical protein
MYDVSEKALAKGKEASLFSFSFDILLAQAGALQALKNVRSGLEKG